MIINFENILPNTRQWFSRYWKTFILHDFILQSTYWPTYYAFTNQLRIYIFCIYNICMVWMELFVCKSKGTCVCRHGWSSLHSRDTHLGCQQCLVARSCSVYNKFHTLCGRAVDEMINGTSQHMLRYNLKLIKIIHTYCILYYVQISN